MTMAVWIILLSVSYCCCCCCCCCCSPAAWLGKLQTKQMPLRLLPATVNGIFFFPKMLLSILCVTYNTVWNNEGNPSEQYREEVPYQYDSHENVHHGENRNEKTSNLNVSDCKRASKKREKKQEEKKNRTHVPPNHKKKKSFLSLFTQHVPSGKRHIESLDSFLLPPFRLSYLQQQQQQQQQ